MNRFYTGVGSRQTPRSILNVMVMAARRLAAIGYTLRSGGAEGADRAFEHGAGNAAIIYRPHHATPDCMKIAAQYHPVWGNLSDYVKRLHARNVLQVLGDDLGSPSAFLICWTRDGAISHSERSRQTGGTGTAISVASAYGVKVFNLARLDHLQRVNNFIQKGVMK